MTSLDGIVTVGIQTFSPPPPPPPHYKFTGIQPSVPVPTNSYAHLCESPVKSANQAILSYDFSKRHFMKFGNNVEVLHRRDHAAKKIASCFPINRWRKSLAIKIARCVAGFKVPIYSPRNGSSPQGRVMWISTNQAMLYIRYLPDVHLVNNC